MECGIFLRYWWSEWNTNYQCISIVGRSTHYFCSELHPRDFFHWSSKCSIFALAICITTIKLRQEIHNRDEASTLNKLFGWRGFHSGKNHEQLPKWFWSVKLVESKMNVPQFGLATAAHSNPGSCSLLTWPDAAYIAGVLDLMKFNLS